MVLSAGLHYEVSGTTRLVWSGREDLNLRPLRPERSALPGCATPRHQLKQEQRGRDCLTGWG